tara:strand:- start:1706 stop:2047 length:342 start_codon:yes stop_codon:yes gene_type:complete
MFEIVLISCSVFLILVIWFKSDAFIEYSGIIGASKFFLIDDFKEKQKSDLTLDYLGYLATYHSSFFIKLITCPICLSVWVTLALCLTIDNLIIHPVCNSFALITFYLFSKISE